jgi:predicted DCC family thiol-disulfide oxidoreductase YuxK
MRTLTIFFDARCGLCCRFSRWLMTQPARVLIQFLPYDSPEALAMFPLMHEVRADRDIVVMADDGRWWQGTSAWLTCLWATCDYRDWSFRLAKPALQPLVSKAVHLLSENRLRLSALLRLRTDADLASFVTHTPVEQCSEGTCAFPEPIPPANQPSNHSSGS